jgi:hypothetical protein
MRSGRAESARPLVAAGNSAGNDATAYVASTWIEPCTAITTSLLGATGRHNHASCPIVIFQPLDSFDKACRPWENWARHFRRRYAWTGNLAQWLRPAIVDINKATVRAIREGGKSRKVNGSRSRRGAQWRRRLSMQMRAVPATSVVHIQRDGTCAIAGHMTPSHQPSRAGCPLAPPFPP